MKTLSIPLLVLLASVIALGSIIINTDVIGTTTNGMICNILNTILNLWRALHGTRVVTYDIPRICWCCVAPRILRSIFQSVFTSKMYHKSYFIAWKIYQSVGSLDFRESLKRYISQRWMHKGRVRISPLYAPILTFILPSFHQYICTSLFLLLELMYNLTDWNL